MMQAHNCSYDFIIPLNLLLMSLRFLTDVTVWYSSTAQQLCFPQEMKETCPGGFSPCWQDQGLFG